MLILSLTTDKISLTTVEACDVDVIAAFVDRNQTTGAIGAADKQLTNITSATTTDIVSVPGGSTTRNIKTMHVRNAHASTTVTVAFNFNANGTLYELYRATLYTGDSVQYVEGVGFMYLPLIPGGRLDVITFLDVLAGQPYGAVDTTEPYDIPGLRVRIPVANTPVNFCAHLYHLASVATVGMQLQPGIELPVSSIGSMLKFTSSQIGANLASATAASLSSGSSVTLTTTTNAALNGPVTQSLTIITGLIQHTTATHIQMRVAVDVAVATGLQFVAGSWMRVWQASG